jgi:hypothetical protein
MKLDNVLLTGTAGWILHAHRPMAEITDGSWTPPTVARSNERATIGKQQRNNIAPFGANPEFNP